MNSSAGFRCSKKHIDWFKIALNAAKIITVQYYEHPKNKWMEVHAYSVKAVSQAGNIWVKDTMTKQKGQSCKILS